MQEDDTYHHYLCFEFVEMAKRGAIANTFHNVVTNSGCGESKPDVDVDSTGETGQISLFVRVRRVQNESQVNATNPTNVGP